MKVLTHKNKVAIYTSSRNDELDRIWLFYEWELFVNVKLSIKDNIFTNLFDQ